LLFAIAAPALVVGAALPRSYLAKRVPRREPLGLLPAAGLPVEDLVLFTDQTLYLPLFTVECLPG